MKKTAFILGAIVLISVILLAGCSDTPKSTPKVPERTTETTTEEVDLLSGKEVEKWEQLTLELRKSDAIETKRGNFLKAQRIFISYAMENPENSPYSFAMETYHNNGKNILNVRVLPTRDLGDMIPTFNYYYPYSCYYFKTDKDKIEKRMNSFQKEHELKEWKMVYSITEIPDLGYTKLEIYFFQNKEDQGY